MTRIWDSVLQPQDTTNIPIETLRSLLVIMQTGGVTAAAARLRLTQPAVSAQIKRLERLVGGPLFEHSRITERGETVARYARKIVGMNDQLMLVLGDQQQLMRLGVSPVMMVYRLHDIFSACRELEDLLKLVIEPSRILEEQLTNAFVDVAIILSEGPRIGAVSHWSEPFAWVVSKNFVLPPARPIPFLAYPGSVSHKRAMEVLEARDIPFRITFTSRDVATHFSLCESGRGVMVFPERFVPTSLTVADWLPKIPALDAGIYVRDGYEPPYLPKAIECLSAAFKP